MNDQVFRPFRNDHRRVLKRLDEIERTSGKRGRSGLLSGPAVAALLDLVSHLRVQFATHMRAEEEVLYPALAESFPEAAASLEPLRSDHRELRDMLGSLEQLLGRPVNPARDEQLVVLVHDFVDLLRLHIYKEEAAVFGVAARVLTPPELGHLADRMAALHKPHALPSDRGAGERKHVMKLCTNTILALSVFVIGLAIAGCGKKADSTASGSGSATAASTGSKYDSGPRAGERPIAEALVPVGEALFKNKGCSACHAFGAKLSGPDLKGVSMRRTALWMENQILHPEVMVKEDPISREMFAKYALQMTNQHLTPDEAKAVIEYLKHQDHEAAEAH